MGTPTGRMTISAISVSNPKEWDYCARAVNYKNLKILLKRMNLNLYISYINVN